MQSLLKMSRAIDAFTKWTGKRLAWLILLAVLVSALNAIVRKTFDTSSNSWLELQWVLFSIVFLLCSPWTLLDNEHIRIDIVNNMLPKPVRRQHRRHGSRGFSAAADHRHDHNGRPVLHAFGRDQRAIGQRRRAPAMARQIADHPRIHVLADSGHIRTDQADRRDARSHSGSARIAGECDSRPRSSTSSRRSKSTDRRARSQGE